MQRVAPVLITCFRSHEFIEVALQFVTEDGFPFPPAGTQVEDALEMEEDGRKCRRRKPFGRRHIIRNSDPGFRERSASSSSAAA